MTEQISDLLKGVLDELEVVVGRLSSPLYSHRSDVDQLLRIIKVIVHWAADLPREVTIGHLSDDERGLLGGVKLGLDQDCEKLFKDVWLSLLEKYKLHTEYLTILLVAIKRLEERLGHGNEGRRVLRHSMPLKILLDLVGAEWRKSVGDFIGIYCELDPVQMLKKEMECPLM